jgi:hypothetical protein
MSSIFAPSRPGPARGAPINGTARNGAAVDSSRNGSAAAGSSRNGASRAGGPAKTGSLKRMIAAAATSALAANADKFKRDEWAGLLGFGTDFAMEVGGAVLEPVLKLVGAMKGKKGGRGGSGSGAGTGNTGGTTGAGSTGGAGKDGGGKDGGGGRSDGEADSGGDPGRRRRRTGSIDGAEYEMEGEDVLIVSPTSNNTKGVIPSVPKRKAKYLHPTEVMRIDGTSVEVQGLRTPDRIDRNHVQDAKQNRRLISAHKKKGFMPNELAIFCGPRFGDAEPGHKPKATPISFDGWTDGVLTEVGGQRKVSRYLDHLTKTDPQHEVKRKKAQRWVSNLCCILCEGVPVKFLLDGPSNVDSGHVATACKALNQDCDFGTASRSVEFDPI